VVVTDIMMPGENRLGVMLQMRSEQPEVTIIAISVGSQVDKRDYLAIAEQLGADAFFRKGLGMNALVEMLNRVRLRVPG
jgi:DNA-binding NarL/FixJ family response regulator